MSRSRDSAAASTSAGPSAHNTPSSSPAIKARPVDLANNRTATGALDPEQRRARREQLRNFYNLDDSTKGKSPLPAAESSSSGNRGSRRPSSNRREHDQGISGSGGAATPTTTGLDIDAPDFDAGVYYQDLIGRSSLVDLMSTAGKLSADIGNLNSSRHSLVYNHHHQLFSAGDTIQLLNVRTPQLLSIVTSLQDSFASISQLADSVAMPAKTLSLGDELAKPERMMQRIRLRATAEEAPERSKAMFDEIEHELVRLGETGNQRAAHLLQEGRTLLGADTLTA